MASPALTNWDTTGQQRLRELVAVHQGSVGPGPGRKWGTEQLNRSLFVALVAQFQAYCVDLHDLAVDVHVNHAAPGQGPLLETLLTQGRKLASQNPRTDHLGSDFGRFGFKLIDEVKQVHSSAPQWLRDLDDLVDFRNAIAHGNETEVAAIVDRTKLRSTKQSFQTCWRTLNRLAPAIDLTVGRKLSHLLGIASPW